MDVWFEHENTIPHCHLKRGQTTEIQYKFHEYIIYNKKIR
jgi:hypothetical protein